MAFNRAFDAAVIDFFGFPCKVYSDLQINIKDKGFSTRPDEKAVEQSKTPSMPVADKQEAAKQSAKAAKSEKAQEAPTAKGETNENDKPFPPAETKADQ